MVPTPPTPLQELMLALLLLCSSWYTFLALANPICLSKIGGTKTGRPHFPVPSWDFLSARDYPIQAEPPRLGDCGVHTRTTSLFAPLCQPIADQASPSVHCNLWGQMLRYHNLYWPEADVQTVTLRLLQFDLDNMTRHNQKTAQACRGATWGRTPQLDF